MTEPSPSAEAILKSDNATIQMFRKLLTEGMSSLYLLSFLLTGNRKEARRCFVAGVADCVDGNRVFKKWAASWARSIIVHNAIQIRITSRRSTKIRRQCVTFGNRPQPFQ